MILHLVGLYEISPMFLTQLQCFSEYTSTVAFARPYQNNDYLVSHQTNKDPEKSRNFPRKISMVESCFDKFTGQHYWCRTPTLAYSLNIFSENSACRAHGSCVFDGKTLLHSISEYVRKNSYSGNCQKKMRKKKSISVNLQADIP